MAVRERDYMKKGGEAPQAAAGPDWLNRLNDFGERHAKIIITVSTALIILTVLVFAKHFFDQSQIERAERELSAAGTIDDLEKLLEKFGSTPVAPKILFRLANRYYQDNKLEDARKTYERFQRNHARHPLLEQVARALASLDTNQKFESEELLMRRKAQELQTYPTGLLGREDPEIRWGPVKQANPVAELDAGASTVTIELFEDEAPEAVAHFVKLCGQNYFDGVKLGRVNTSERLETQAKAQGAVAYSLPYEETSREAEAYSLILLRKEGAPENVAGRFQILLRTLPDLKDVTVFGIVTGGAPLLTSVKQDDAIKSLKVVSKRDHPYEPKTIEQK